MVKQLVSSSQDSTVKLWDAGDARGPFRPGLGVTFYSDGKQPGVGVGIGRQDGKAGGMSGTGVALQTLEGIRVGSATWLSRRTASSWRRHQGTGRSSYG